jgi:general secretion pathway protein D
MEPFKPNYSICLRACCVVLACCFAPLYGGENPPSSSSNKEQSRRNLAVEEARELLTKGDAAYGNARYADAVEAYAGAREMIPDAPISAELRAAATQRHSQASVELARALSRKGDVPGATIVVENALSISPEDPDALAFRNELNDPIRTNPALTKEHAQNVDSVRRLLYTAQGAYDLGKFDQAKQEYEKVLRIDPTNSAARRGMEQVATAKTTYFKSAYDHTRAEMLGQVEASWELKVPPLDFDPGLTQNTSGAIGTDAIPASNKIDRIIVPRIDLDQTTLSEAIDFLRVRAAENDTLESDPSRKGVNFTVNLGPPDSEVAKRIQRLRFDLRLSQVPLSQALKYIGDLTQTTFTTDDFSVIISPLGSTSDELVSRNYRVPPDFISSLTSGASAAPGGTDPFGSDSNASGILTTRMGAREALEKQGVNFPEGASVTYLPSNNILRVINTPTNQDYIAQVIQSIAQTEPIMISVRLTMIETEQTNLEELGFDWLLTPFGFGGDDFNLSGGTTGNGTAITDVPNSPIGADPITSGLRNGDAAISGDSIDSLIGNQRGSQTNERAPGIFGLRGSIDDTTFNMLMRGLDLKKSTDVLSKPAITTRSGQSTSIVIAREFIYPTEYEPPELPTSTSNTTIIIIDQNGNISGGSPPTSAVTPATPTAFEKRDTGVTLEVLPVADANKQYIDVTLSPQFVNFDGFVNYGSPINSIQGSTSVLLTENAILMPIFSKNSVTSSLRIADGATIVVGGLLKNSIQDVEDKVPVLGSIPFVGRFFQTKARQPISKAVIFLVNVEIIDPTGRPYRDR